ncbi:MAG TPA: mismatch-specific DNA-glycosylase [Planctomycetota bacterium]|nr:mismatch-specific DNA-glycosylase [Planctomycetota bacterium]
MKSTQRAGRAAAGTRAVVPRRNDRPVLPDVLGPKLRVVFCGTAAGAASARREAYYAGPGNRFWATLFEAGFVGEALTPERYREVLRFGVGLTDLAKHEAGNDDELSEGAFDVDGFLERIETVAPQIIAFTSKNAARAFLGRDVDYGLVRERLGDTRLYVLPSPSGAARGAWSIAPWRRLARMVGAGEMTRRAAASRRRGTRRAP